MVDETEVGTEHSDKPIIGISRCLLGDPVRYDGQARPVSWIIDILSEHCDFLPICPEVEAGFGVPRPPMRLEQRGADVAVVLIEHPEQEKTEKLRSASADLQKVLHNTDGLILKARSPSCAVKDALIYDQTGTELGKGAGVFTRICLAQRPGLPVVDEQALESEAGRIAFLVQVFRYCCRHRT